MTTCNESDDIQPELLAMEKPNRLNVNRYTYGAYTNSTLPRGPYLQYKYNDCQQNGNQMAVHIDTSDSRDLPATNTNSIDNNEHRHKQIEQLKKEFFCLPRARVHSAHSDRSKSDKCADGKHIRLAYAGDTASNGQTYPKRDRIDGHDDATDNSPAFRSGAYVARGNCNVPALQVQTLGRYKQNGKHRTADGVSNAEYIYGTDRLVASHATQPYSGHYGNCRGGRSNPGLQPSKSMTNFNDDIKFWDVYDDRTMKKHSQYGGGYEKHAVASSSMQDRRTPSSIFNNERVGNGTSTLTRNRETKSSSVGFVMLADVMKVKPHGVSDSEGWALLCQSVQALQDLFLSGKSQCYRLGSAQCYTKPQ